MELKWALLWASLCLTSMEVRSEINLTKSDSLIADAYYQKADSLLDKRLFSQALNHYQQASTHFKNTNGLKYIHCLNGIANCYFQLTEYQKALSFIHQLRLLNTVSSKEDSVEYAFTLNTTAGIYHRLGQLELASKYLESALIIKEEVLPPAEIAATYSNMGVLSMAKGEYEKALKFYDLALEIRSSDPDTRLQRAAILYRNMGTVYMDQDKLDLALETYNKAIEVSRQHLEHDHGFIGSIYSDIGYLYWKKKDNEESLRYHQMAIQLLEDWVDRDSNNLSRAYTNHAITYIETANYDLSIHNLKKAVAESQKILGAKNRRTSRAFLYISKVFELQEQIDSALWYAQKSLTAIVPDFEDINFQVNPKVANSYDIDLFGMALHHKAVLMDAAVKKTSNYGDLLIALSTYQSCDSLITNTRRERFDLIDKINFDFESSTVYQNAVNLAQELWISTSEEKYLELAFHLTEKSKTGMLNEGLSLSVAKVSAGIPNKLLSIEDSIRGQISLLRSQILLEQSIGNVDLRQNLILADQTLQEHLELYERDYPFYHEVKYKTEVTQLDQIRDKLDHKTALIEYFIGSDDLFTFLITNAGTETIKTPIDSAFAHRIENFRAILEPKSQGEKFDVNYKSKGYELYQLLLDEPLAKIESTRPEIDRLIIIPDGSLGYIPFDLLLTRKPSEQENYQELPYLLQDYTVSYGYSATSLFRNYKKKRREERKEYLGFAPSYPELLSDSTKLLALGGLRDALTDLLWNKEEVKSAAKYMDGEYYLSEAANETAFKENVNNYKIVHLAMHALIDDEEPMNSKLLFSQNDSIEDGYLHTYELYNMDIDSDLAVLSACNTGYGKLAKGEGIMSLGMGFAYAGCPSMVISHWNANDKTTADLMSLFYKHLADGEDKDVALRLAKLEFLDNATADVSHPFYWGSFVVIGDTSPIDLRTNYSREIMIAIGLLVISLLAFWMFFRKSVTNSFRLITSSKNI